MLLTAQPFSNNEKKNTACLNRRGIHEESHKGSDAMTPDFSAIIKKCLALMEIKALVVI
jgi:hypothetical protein